MAAPWLRTIWHGNGLCLATELQPLEIVELRIGLIDGALCDLPIVLVDERAVPWRRGYAWVMFECSMRAEADWRSRRRSVPETFPTATTIGLPRL